MRARLTGLLVPLALAFATAPAAVAAENFRTLLPSEAETTSRILSTRVEPGGDNRMSFLVRGNGAPTKIDARLVPVSSDGGILHEVTQPPAPGTPDPRDWVTLSGPSSMTATAEQALVLHLDVLLPEDTAPGDYAGGVLVSAAGESELLPYLIRVPGPRTTELSVEEASFAVEGIRAWPFTRGAGELSMTVRNTGALVLHDTAEVYGRGLFGLRSLSTEVEDVILLPGDTMSLESAGGVSPGVNLEPVFEFTVPYTDDSGTPRTYRVAATAEGVSTFSGTPVLLAGAVLLSLLAGWLVAQRRAARRNTAG